MIDQFINDEFGNYTFIILSILIGLLVILIIYPNIMNQNQNEGFKIDEQINQILNKALTTQPSNTDTTQPNNTDTTQPNNTDTNQPSNTDTNQPSNTDTTQPSNTNIINTNTTNNIDLNKIDKNICSKQCCKFVQWPIPFNTRNPIVKDDVLDNFIPSNFACNGGENGGCVCLTKDNYKYLSNHGQN